MVLKPNVMAHEDEERLEKRKQGPDGADGSHVCRAWPASRRQGSGWSPAPVGSHESGHLQSSRQAAGAASQLLSNREDSSIPACRERSEGGPGTDQRAEALGCPSASESSVTPPRHHPQDRGHHCPHGPGGSQCLDQRLGPRTSLGCGASCRHPKLPYTPQHSPQSPAEGQKRRPRGKVTPRGL